MTYRALMLSAVLGLGLAAATPFWTPAIAQESAPVDAEPVSPFKGSTLLGKYTAEFNRLLYLVATDAKPEIKTAEGPFVSSFYAMPQERTSLEVIGSYGRALEKAGFEILFKGLKSDLPHNRFGGPLYEIERKNNAVYRDYKHPETGKKAPQRVVFGTYASGYISATKTLSDGRTVIVAVSSGDMRKQYAVDVIGIGEAEADTVTINLDQFSKGFANEGRIAIYDLFFATNSADLTGESDAALQVIVDFFKANPNAKAYVVGHTDDQGALDYNMDLSKRRAASVVKAVVSRGIHGDRLIPRGVGPLSPVATNRNDAGRAKNRRVEIVERRK